MANTPVKLRQVITAGTMIAILACALGAAPGATERVLPPLKLEGTMVCVGGSITAGEGVKPQECYVSLLRAKATAENLNLQVINLGRGGWSTGEFLANRKKILKLLPADATIVTFMLGMNDSREDGTPDEIAKHAAGNLDKLMNFFQAKAPHVQFVVLSPTRSFPGILARRLLEANYSEETPEKLAAIGKAFEGLATSRGCLFIDLSDLPSSVNDSIDGVHLKAAGHQAVFASIWKSLDSRATKAPASSPSS